MNAGTQIFTDGSYTCNCVCGRCVDGTCCQAPDYTRPPYTVQMTAGTTWPSPSVVVCAATEHNFEILDPARLYCRKCGTTRNV